MAETLMRCHTCLCWRDRRLFKINPKDHLPLDNPSCIKCVAGAIRRSRSELKELLAIQARIEARSVGVSREEVPYDDVQVTRPSTFGMGGDLGRRKRVVK